jgi:undecaprenyl-diphosphatase
MPAAAAAGFVVLTVAVAARVPVLERSDRAVSTAARGFAVAHPWWRATLTVITHSADTVAIVGVAAVSLAVLLWRRQWSSALFLLVAALGATAVRLVVLWSVARPRPPGRLTATAGWAYPSGHTTSATVTAGVAVVVVLAVVRARMARRAVVFVAPLWAALVGVSRVALAAHWPTDVIGGWLLALAVVGGLAGSRLRPGAQGSARTAASGGAERA